MKIAIYSRKSKFTGKFQSIGNRIQLCREYISSHFPEARDNRYSCMKTMIFRIITLCMQSKNLIERRI